MRALVVGGSALLALLGAALSIEHLLDADHYNPGFSEHPWLIRSHVVLGGIYLALVLPQFHRGIRRAHPRLHRASGRVAAFAGVAAGITALAIGVMFPFGGAAATVVVVPFAGWFVLSLVRGFRLARAGRLAEHREWMIRAFAVATGITTQRLLFVPALLLLGEDGERYVRSLSVASTAAAFALHSAAAEMWIRRMDGRGRDRGPASRC